MSCLTLSSHLYLGLPCYLLVRGFHLNKLYSITDTYCQSSHSSGAVTVPYYAAYDGLVVCDLISCRKLNDFVLVIFKLLLNILCGPGSSVGVATDYGLDGPVSNPGGGEIFRPSRPALGPTRPSVLWVPGFSRGVKYGRGVALTTHPLLVPWSWKSRASWAFMATSRVNFTFYYKPVISQLECYSFCTALATPLRSGTSRDGGDMPGAERVLVSVPYTRHPVQQISIVGSFALQGPAPWSVLVSVCMTCLAKYLAYYRIAAVPHSHTHRPSAFWHSRARLGSSSALGSVPLCSVTVVYITVGLMPVFKPQMFYGSPAVLHMDAVAGPSFTIITNRISWWLQFVSYRNEREGRRTQDYGLLL